MKLLKSTSLNISSNGNPGIEKLYEYSSNLEILDITKSESFEMALLYNASRVPHKMESSESKKKIYSPVAYSKPKFLAHPRPQFS